MIELPKLVVAHLHNNGIRYSVNVAGRCDWCACTHNVYDSFDVPEQIVTDDQES